MSDAYHINVVAFKEILSSGKIAESTKAIRNRLITHCIDKRVSQGRREEPKEVLNVGGTSRHVAALSRVCICILREPAVKKRERRG